MSYRKRRVRRKRRKNPSLHDIDETTKLVIGLVIGGVVLYFGVEIFSFVGNVLSAVAAPFKAAGAAIGQGVQTQSIAQTANTDATGNAVLDSLSVGAAGGG